MISNTIASALTASASSQRQDAASSPSTATDDSSDCASFSSAMANAKVGSASGDASTPEGSDASKQTPADTGQGEASANAQTATQTPACCEKTANASTASRSAASSRVALSSERSCATNRASSTAKSPAPIAQAFTAEADSSTNRQTSAKAEADKPTSRSQALQVSATPTADTSAPVGANNLPQAEVNVATSVQAAAAQIIRPDPSTPVASDRPASLPSAEASVVGLPGFDRADQSGAEGIPVVQGESQAVPDSDFASGANASAAGAVQSFATLLARPEKANADPANGKALASMDDLALANAGTSPVSSSTAALTSLASAPLHGGAALGLVPNQVNVATRVGDPGFGQDVSQQLVFLVKTGARSAQLSLQPAELGPVSVSIQMNGLQASLVISASHAATRVALQEALPHLGELFQSSGLQLADAQVGDGSARNADQGGVQRQALAVEDPLGSTVAARATASGVNVVAGSRLVGSRLIDTFA